LTGLHDQLIETTDIKRRFAAPAIDDDVHHAEIHTQDLGYLQQEIRRLIDQPDMLLNWLGNTMSEAKYPEYQTPLTDEDAQLALENALSGQPFFRPGDARICYGIVPNDTNKIRVFSHYDSIEVQEELTSLVQAIADQTEFDFSGLNVDANPDIKPLLLFLMKQLTLVELTEG
jgi:50S ribosomal protein L16 3-hydroxylase